MNKTWVNVQDATWSSLNNQQSVLIHHVSVWKRCWPWGPAWTSNCPLMRTCINFKCGCPSYLLGQFQNTCTLIPNLVCCQQWLDWILTFGSEASFLRMPLTFPCLSSDSMSKKFCSVILKISLQPNKKINDEFVKRQEILLAASMAPVVSSMNCSSPCHVGTIQNFYGEPKGLTWQKHWRGHGHELSQTWLFN